MSELEPNSTNPNFDQTKPLILIYRGLNKWHEGDSIGEWWTTNPYLALEYSNNENGVLFVAAIDGKTAKSLTNTPLEKIVFENHRLTEDPPGARPATPEEIEALKAAVPSPRAGDSWPDGFKEIGQTIFSPK